MEQASVSVAGKPSSEVLVRARSLGATVVFSGSMNERDLLSGDAFLVSVTALSDESFSYVFDSSGVRKTISLN